MSETLCTLRTKGGGGGKYTETSLWTNSSPTSNFSGQDVTLSESIDNFKYIAVKFKSTTTSSSDSQMATVIYKVEDVKKATSPSAALQPVSAFGNLNSGNTNYNYRYIVYKGSTTLFIANAYSINASGNNNALAIPLEILGLNELDHGKKFDETTLWTNSAPTSSFAAQNVTLSDNLSNYDYFKIKFRLSTTQDTSAMVMDSVSDFLTNYSNSSSTWRGTMFYTTSTVHLIRRFRNVDISGSEIRFMATMTCTISDHTWTDSSGNLTYLIPTEIIGCKFR